MMCCDMNVMREKETAMEGREAAPVKYVLITGGVVSGLGKGVTASSIGVVLHSCGLRVTSVKIGSSLPLSPSLSR